MTQRKLGVLVQGASAVLGLLLLCVCGWPALRLGGRALPEESCAGVFYLPALGCLWLTALPCLLALGYLWRVGGRIARGEVFCAANERALTRISSCGLLDAGLYLAATLVYFCLPGGRAFPLIGVILGMIGLIGLCGALLVRALAALAGQERVHA